MKVTKDDLLSIGLGKTKVFTLTPREMLSTRSYIYNLSLVTGAGYKTKYNKKTLAMSITRVKR